MSIFKNITSFWKLAIAIILCEGIGIISGLLTANEIGNWFTTINKPMWNPPGYLFGPVWTILYLLMAIALWLVWKTPTESAAKSNAINFFIFQLSLNFLWSLFFFKLHSPALAFLNILLLIITILITIFSFAKISKNAAWLLVPYISWVCFAAVLNYTIWMLN